MARIFQFPLQPRMRQAQNPLKNAGIRRGTWREHPIFFPLYLVAIFCIFCVLCCWPLALWLLAIDIIIQLIRIGFSDGWGRIYAVMHLILIGLVAYVALAMGTKRPPKG